MGENMGENKYKRYTPIDGNKPIWVIVDKNGKIINKNPNKEELKELKEESHQKYTKCQLLKYLIQFYQENGSICI